MYSPRCFFPWCSRKLPGWSQLFSGSACKGHITHVISKKCQRRQEIQKNPSHLGPLDGVWEERLADIVTPLWRLNYEQQLKVKFEAQKKILQRLESYLQILNGVKVTTAAPKLDGLCCLLHPIIPSPVIDGYRNRSTFSMNRGPDGNPKTVGYYLGTWRGITNCELHVGRAEKILPHLLKTQEDGKLIVGVVNPARAGLHHRVVQAI